LKGNSNASVKLSEDGALTFHNCLQEYERSFGLLVGPYLKIALDTHFKDLEKASDPEIFDKYISTIVSRLDDKRGFDKEDLFKQIQWRDSYGTKKEIQTTVLDKAMRENSNNLLLAMLDLAITPND
jgi:hypothetical protein